METIIKYISVVTSSSNMNLVLGTALCLMCIASLTGAQTRVRCFDKNKGKDRTGIVLDCSNTADKNHPYSIEEWIRYHAFFDDGILANRVLHINLENNNFQTLFTLPSMTSLKKLSFRYNNISSIENKAFSNLPALEELDISFNSLTRTPHLYHKLKLKRDYDLRQNIFRSQQRSNIHTISEDSPIKILRLGHNNIHSLSPDCFQYLRKLEVLELHSNPLKVIDQNTEIALGHLKNLQNLDLGNTDISEFPEDVFSNLGNVQTLYLNGNRFQKIPDAIRNMPLAYLNVNANPIEYLDNESFVGLDQLQQLIISGMPKLTDIGSGAFAPLKKLVILQMSYNPRLSHVHYDAFRDQTAKNPWSLRQLSMSYNNLTALDARLYPWTKLDLFDAKSNRWNCDCRLIWLAKYINESFVTMPETLLNYRCNEPEDLYSTLVSQLNDHIECDEFDQMPVNHSHGHATRLRHFVIVIGLVIGIFVIGTVINMSCREMKKWFKPRMCVPTRFSTGVKYRPADFEETTDTVTETPAPVKQLQTTIHGRSPIVINNGD